jgi:hypothetical protein
MGLDVQEREWLLTAPHPYIPSPAEQERGLDGLHVFVITQGQKGPQASDVVRVSE